MRKERALEMRCAALLAAQAATDAQAVSMPSLYPQWAPGTACGGEGQPRIASDEGNLFRCIRSTEQPVAYLPHELVGQYFEEAV